MREAIRQWLAHHKTNPLFIGTAGIFLGFFLNKVLPFVKDVVQPAVGWMRKKIGGRFAQRQFERDYLNWLYLEVRELKLAGAVTQDEVKKPQLEQVFVSVRVGERKETTAPTELASMLIEYFYCRTPSIRNRYDKAEILENILPKLTQLDHEQLQMLDTAANSAPIVFFAKGQES